VKGWDQTGANQRRLPTSGGADDRQKSAGTQPSQQLVDLFLSSEEEVILVGLEGT
jgi:hypothetical protein